MLHQVKTYKIKINPNNPRLIKGNKFKKLVQSIKDFPEMLKLRPIVVNKEMIVLGGNMRLKACIDAGLKDIWIAKAWELTPEQEKEFIIKDNVGFGDWDWDVLANEWDMKELEDWGLDGFPFKDVLEAEEDDYTEPDDLKVDVVLGDLIEIGEHRLLCGDSTDADQVAKLMNGEKADMVFTDPPYNVAFNGRSGKFDVIKNDNISENDFENLINGFVSILNILKPDNYYVWCNWKFYGLLQSKLDFKACIVWAKNVFGLGRGYRGQYEVCFYLGEFNGSDSDVWDVAKDTNYVHPTQKPVELCSRAIKNSKPKNILDLYAGSGSTLMGCQKHGIPFFGMEFDTQYIDVIIRRWQEFTGKQAINEATGKTFADTEAKMKGNPVDG